MKRALLLAVLLAPAHAGDVFTDGAAGAKVHEASGFVCPGKIGEFERDAVGQRDPEAHEDYCAYSALDGVYAGVTLRPLPKNYDPREALAANFAVLDGTGGKLLAEWVQWLGPKTSQVSAYLRSYETARLESIHYRTVFASAAVGGWAVQVTVEYADPRDRELEQAFLNAVYDSAIAKIADPPASPDVRRNDVKKAGLTSLDQHKQ